jgi:four helix bundle protein
MAKGNGEEVSSGKCFTELEVWKKMRELKKEIEAVIKTFPPEEKFCLSFQLRKSSRGVNSNIAEGHGRYTYPDRINFCIMGRGSLSETHNHLIDAFDLGYITKERLDDLHGKIQEVQRLLNGYINWLKKFK